MSDDKKITSIADFIKRKEEAEPRLIVLDDYTIDASHLILDFDSKIRLLQAMSINRWVNNKDVRSADISKLVSVLVKVMQWVILPPDMMGNISAREQDTPEKLLSLYLFATPVTRIAEIDSPTVDDQAFQLEVSFIDHEAETVVNTGRIIDVDDINISQKDDNFMNLMITKQVLRNMNSLVGVNGGKGIMATGEGAYVVFIPHTVTKSVMIVLRGDMPFTVGEPDEES